MSPRNVALMHDGAIDELMSVMLLASMPDVSIFYIDVLNADCLAQPTYQTTVKMLQMIGRTDDIVFVSDARGWNPFPWAYRQYAMMVNLLPMVNQYASPSSVPAPRPAREMAQMLTQAKEADDTFTVSFLVLCPLTDLAGIVSNLPDPSSIIDSVVWMGGVYSDTPGELPTGNIDTGIAPGANPNAEWNAYWDPDAVDTVLASGLNIQMFPLNVTNRVLLTPEIIETYFLSGSRRSAMLDLAAQMYAMVAFQTGFSFWDTVTTAFVGKPDLFQMEQKAITIDTGDDPQTQGTISVGSTGYPVQMATSVDKDGFYEYLVGQLTSLSVSCWPPGP